MIIKYINRKTGKVEIEKTPGENFLKFLYHNPFGKIALITFVKRKFFSHLYGLEMNKPSSKKKIRPFIKKLNIDMSEAQKKICEFTSFNDFFYRKLKPNSRPIESGIVSPGDGKILAFEKISDINTFLIKGKKFTLIEFLGNEKLAKKYNNASLIILRLAPNDYHRYHFPYKGKISPSKKIKGCYYSVSPYSLINNFTKVFCENKREFSLLFTQEKGTFIICPIGATMVGSIINTYKPNTVIKKGDEMGYFAFGGSTIVIIIDKNKINIDKDILENTKNKIETFVKMGEKIGS